MLFLKSDIAGVLDVHMSNLAAVSDMYARLWFVYIAAEILRMSILAVVFDISKLGGNPLHLAISAQSMPLACIMAFRNCAVDHSLWMEDPNKKRSKNV